MKRLINRAASALGVTALAAAGLVATAPASTAASEFSVRVINTPSCTETSPKVRVWLNFQDKKGTSVGFDSTRDPDTWDERLYNAKNGTYTLTLPAVPSGYTEEFRIKLEHNPGTSKRRELVSKTFTFAVKAGCPGTKPVFTTTPDPALKGTLRVGQTLSVNTGTWAPTQPTSFTYKWQRAHSGNIKGGTKSTYRLTAADLGKQLRVIITAKHKNHSDMRRTSVWSVPVKQGVFVKKPTPTVSGTPKVGSKLTATAGAWWPAPTKVSYQWYRNGAKISGATSRTRTLTSADRGRSLKVKVTGSRAAFVTDSATSAGISVR